MVCFASFLFYLAILTLVTVLADGQQMLNQQKMAVLFFSRRSINIFLTIKLNKTCPSLLSQIVSFS